MFGISLLSVVIALGCEYTARKVKPRKGAAATTGGASGGGGGAGSGTSPIVMAQHWSAAFFYLLSGICWAVAFWPIVGAIDTTWIVVLLVFGGLGMTAVAVFETWKDKKPDGPTFVAARVLPLLMLVVFASWATFTGAVGDQVEQYQSNLTTSTAK